jgi:hypothetical protein
MRRLRLADAALASVSPSADLEARIRARAKGRGAPRLSSMLAGARRLHRPLILAFATAAALFAVSGLRGQGIGAPSRIAGGAEEPADHIVNDRIRADGGPSEPTPGERAAGPRPVFHMPSLDPRPSHPDHALCIDLGGDLKDPNSGIQLEATAACAELGLDLGGFSVDAVDCPARSGKVAYVCCPTPAPSPGVDTCYDSKVGSSTCEDLSTLEAAAATLCAQNGDALATLTPLSGCPDGQASIAMISCCPPAP